MNFDFTQRFAAERADVADGLSDPGFYESLGGSTKLGPPDVLDRTVDGDKIEMRIRYKFAGDLSGAVTAVIDPDKLTWVELSVHDLERHHVTFELAPDHYADRLAASGSYTYLVDPEDDGATLLRAKGQVKVRALLVASAVERAIISGLEEHLAAQASALVSYLARG